MEHLLCARGWAGVVGRVHRAACSQPPCPASKPPLCGCGERHHSAVGRHCLSPAGSNPGLRPCRLAEAGAGLKGSILSSRGASASEDCNRATCIHLQRERQTETQRDGERQRHTHTHRQGAFQSFLPVKAQFLAEHLRLWDFEFSSTNKQQPLYLEGFGGPALRLGPRSPMDVLRSWRELKSVILIYFHLWILA